MNRSLIDIQSELQATISNGRQWHIYLEKITGVHSVLSQSIKIVPKWYIKAERAKRGVPEPVDLGLSVLWAGKNVGAPSEEQPGYWVGWGDVTAENASTDYNDYPSSNPPCKISGGKSDIARKMWAESWRLPSEDEMKELMQLCQWTWLEKSEIPGFQVTGKNGNSIFLPAGGRRYGFDVEGAYEYGCYWCGDLCMNDSKCALSLEFSSTNGNIVSRSRYMGLLIRPVLTKDEGGY